MSQQLPLQDQRVEVLGRSSNRGNQSTDPSVSGESRLSNAMSKIQITNDTVKCINAGFNKHGYFKNF